MGNFQKGGSRGGFRGGSRGDNGGGGDFKKKSWGNDRGGDRGRGPVTMHRATCGDCGRSCEVPFRPNGDRPVLCNDCFGGKRDGDRGGDRSYGERPARKEYNDTPAVSKPVQNTDELKKQLNEINAKFDRLINLFEESLKIKKVVVGEKAPAKAKKVVTKKVK